MTKKAHQNIFSFWKHTQFVFEDPKIGERKMHCWGFQKTPLPPWNLKLPNKRVCWQTSEKKTLKQSQMSMSKPILLTLAISCPSPRASNFTFKFIRFWKAVHRTCRHTWEYSDNKIVVFTPMKKNKLVKNCLNKKPFIKLMRKQRITFD